jgi:hypothetical protein
MRTILLMFGVCLASCSMLKQKSNTNAMEQADFKKVLDSRSLVLKTAIRETNTLTYHPDGSILQFQQVQEEVAQTQATQVLDTENASVKKELLIKESVPWNGWSWIIGIGITLTALLIYIKFFR